MKKIKFTSGDVMNSLTGSQKTPSLLQEVKVFKPNKEEAHLYRQVTDQEFNQLCKEAKKFVSDYLKVREKRFVKVFYESVGLAVPDLNKTDTIHKIYHKYLEDAIEEKIIGHTSQLSLKKLDPYFAFYKKHKECKTFDIQEFTEAPNLKPLFELATKSQIERIVINQTIKSKLTEEEYYALRDAKIAKPSLQFDLVVEVDTNTNVKPSSKNSAPATSPIVSRPATSSHSPNTSPTSSPTHPSVMATRYSPPRSPEANKPASGSPPKHENSTILAEKRSISKTGITNKTTRNPKTLNYLENALANVKIQDKPAYVLLLKFLATNPNASYKDGLDHLCSLTDETVQRQLKIEFIKSVYVGKVLNGKPCISIFEKYLEEHPNCVLKDATNYMKSLRVQNN